MRRRKPKTRKPMPPPSRPFKDKREAHLDRIVRKVLLDYHRTFIALPDD